MTPQDFQQIVKEARKKAGLTQQQLADRIGVNKLTITQFETDKRNITIDVLCRILTALDLRLITINEQRRAIIEQIASLAKVL